MPKSPPFENVLPSPAPSEEHRHETICIIDLEDGDETISGNREVSVTDEAAKVRLLMKRRSRFWPSLISCGRVLEHTMLVIIPLRLTLMRFKN